MGWQSLGPLEAFAEGEPVAAELDRVDGVRVELAVIRRGAAVYVVSGRCPHRGAPFAETGFVDDEGQLVCGWHYWAFRLEDGQHSVLESVRLCRFPTKVEGGEVWTDVDLAAGG